MARLMACLALLSASTAAAPAQKTDVVTFTNGDQITCDIKELVHGRLRVKTDTMETVYVRWSRVASLESTQLYNVELSDGRKVTGVFTESDNPRRLRILTPEGTVQELGFDGIIFIYVLEQSLASRIKGDISAGFTFTKATDISQLSLGFNLRARTEKNTWRAGGNLINTTQEAAPATQRADLSLSYQRFLKERWFWMAVTSAEHNDALGLNLRSLFSGGAGRTLYQSTKMELSTLAGLSVNREFRQDDQNTNNLEAVVAANYAWYLYDTPKLDLDTSIQLFPSLTESDRYRVSYSGRLRQEIVEDLFWSLRLYYDYDSQPSAGATRSSDYGIIFSLGYSW